MNEIFYPYPWERLRGYKKVFLFGAGRVGTDYYEQLKSKGVSVSWVDSSEKARLKNPVVNAPEACADSEEGLWVIAVSDQDTAAEISRFLAERGIAGERIFWEKPELRPLLPLLEQDAFLKELGAWKFNEISEHRELFFSLKTDLDVLVEDLKRVQLVGNYERREWYVDRERKVAYLNNAKVACTSVLASLAKMAEDQNYLDLHHKMEPGLLHRGTNEELNQFYKFTFVRNPFTRLVSCYRNKYHTDRKILGEDSSRLYFGWSRYLMGYLQEDQGFPEFVRKISRIPTRWQDRHFRSQYDLIYGDGCPAIDYLGRFEDLPDAYEAISGRFALPPLDRHNASGDIRWESFYDEETANLVHEKYIEDFTAFGYEEEYGRLLKEIRAGRQ